MLRVAVRALGRNILRTFLTMLGVIIGVAAVTAMVSVGTGAKAQMEAQVAGLGQNVVMVMAGSLARGGVFSGLGGAASLTLEDAAREAQHLAVDGGSGRGGVLQRVAHGHTVRRRACYGLHHRQWAVPTSALGRRCGCAPVQ